MMYNNYSWMTDDELYYATDDFSEQDLVVGFEAAEEQRAALSQLQQELSSRLVAYC